MARTWWVRRPAAVSEGDSLDAAMCTEGIFGNAEAVYEEARWDHCVILPAYLTPAGTDLEYVMGPIPVPMRWDRDGLLRSLMVSVLAAEGTGDDLTLYGVLTDDYRVPRAIETEGDPWVEWTVSEGSSTCDWQTYQELIPPRIWTCRSMYSVDDGDEAVHVDMAWLWIYGDNPDGCTGPRFAGLHVYEHIDT